MIYAILDTEGNVINRVVADKDWTSPEGISIPDDNYAIGGKYLDGVYTPPVYEGTPQIVKSISDRQFFQQLSVLGIITEEQALASNAAVIPPPLMSIIETLPQDQQFSAKMIVSGATVYERNHPLVEAIGAAYGWTSQQIDNFFSEASKL